VAPDAVIGMTIAVQGRDPPRPIAGLRQVGDSAERLAAAPIQPRHHRRPERSRLLLPVPPRPGAAHATRDRRTDRQGRESRRREDRGQTEPVRRPVRPDQNGQPDPGDQSQLPGRDQGQIGLTYRSVRSTEFHRYRSAGSDARFVQCRASDRTGISGDCPLRWREPCGASRSTVHDHRFTRRPPDAFRLEGGDVR